MEHKTKLLKLCGLVALGLLIYWVGVAIYTGGLDVLFIPLKLMEKKGGVMVYSGEATAQVGTNVIRYEVYSGGVGFSEGFSTCDLVLLRRGSDDGGCRLLWNRLLVTRELAAWPGNLQYFKLLPFRLLPIVTYSRVPFDDGAKGPNAEKVGVFELDGCRVYKYTYFDYAAKRQRELTLTVPLSCWRN